MRESPRAATFCDGLHRVNECPVRNRLAAIVQAKEESECESRDDDRHQKEPKRLGAIRVWDGHHEEQPKKVFQLAALRSCCESSQVEKKETKTVAKGCHDASVEA